MPIVPYITDEDIAGQKAPVDLVAAIRARRAGGKLLNLDRMLLHSAPIARGWNTYMGSIRRDLKISPILRELAICAIARLNRADYEWFQHVPEFLAAAMPPPGMVTSRLTSGKTPSNSKRSIWAAIIFSASAPRILAPSKAEEAGTLLAISRANSYSSSE